MKRGRVLLLGALLMLLTAATVPAVSSSSEETVMVAIENRTGGSIRLELKGNGGLENLLLGAGQTASRELVVGEEYSLCYRPVAA